jgi:four helix bundle protein
MATVRSSRSKFVRKHADLEVFKKAFELSMQIFQLSRKFPAEERYSLTDQIRRSSRSICANLSEGRRKRRYPAAFISKLSDAEGEAAETQTWLQFAVECKYLNRADARELYRDYDAVIGMPVNMSRNSSKWTLP